MTTRPLLFFGITVLLLASLVFYFLGRGLWVPVVRKALGNSRTVDEVVTM